jgi:hypothetical protein
MSSEHVSRREFMSAGLIAGEAAALALLSGRRILANNRPLIIDKHAPGTPYKLGLLGCGNRSKAHIAALNAVAEIEVAALCDIVPHKMDERAKLIRQGPEPRKYVDMENMVQQDGLDAIAVLLPNHIWPLPSPTATK